MNDTTRTMASASSSEEMNSSNDLSTTSGWLETRCTVMRPQLLLDIGHHLVERLAQRLHVAALGHHHAEPYHRLALEAHGDLLRVLVAALDLGHVGLHQRAAVGAEGQEARSSADRGAPSTRTETLSPLVSTVPAATMAFCRRNDLQDLVDRDAQHGSRAWLNSM